jgi:transketolase
LYNIENYINISTRELSNICLNIINKNNNNIIIGSADLTESTRTIIESDYINKNNFDNKYIHFGIRENAMVSIANGMSCYNIIPIISTFLIFINYCLAGIRIAALSKHKVIYILTHDSVLIGEDGPTHQPIESLTILRSIPNLITIRPYNMYEVFNGYNYALSYN